MNPRVLIYGALLTAIIVAGVVVRSFTKRDASDKNDEGEHSLASGVFAFRHMLPFYPAPYGRQPSGEQKPTLEATWNVLTSETQFVLMINDAGPFTVSVWVDGWPMGETAKPVFSFPYLTITFPEVALAPGERNVFIRFVKDTENWGWAQTKLDVKSDPCRSYEKIILWETARIYDLERRDGALREGLLAFQRYLLLPCRYGMLDRGSLVNQIDAFIETLKAQESDFWEIIAGKALTRTEVRLALKVFKKNWETILKGISEESPSVSPFVRPDIAETAAQIVETLKKHQQGKA